MPAPISPPTGKVPPEPCKHTVVRIVSRNEDGEFVECQSCGEIFDSIEYEDMALEEQDAGLDPDPEDTGAKPKPVKPRPNHRAPPPRRR